MNQQAEGKGTKKKKSSEDRTVILSDEYLSESGVQGGKIIAEQIVLGSLLFGISLLIVGLFSLCYMFFIVGFPKDMPILLILLSPQSIALIIGLLLTIGGYFIYRDKQRKK
jgi:hypothetical protein